jgi:competence protein ComGC
MAMIIEKAPGDWKGESGFTRAEAVISIGVAVFVFLAILFPALQKAKARSSRIGCANVLKNVGLAFREFAIDNDGLFPMARSTNSGGSKESVGTGEVYPHFQVMSNELCWPRNVVCPVDAQQGRKEAQSFTQGFSDATISYFVGLEATETNSQSILSGDRNLGGGIAAGKRIFVFTNQGAPRWDSRIHGNFGYLCYGDGSVMTINNNRLPSQFIIPTNSIIRLAIPP